jgi:hypothetical protein
VTVSGLWAFDCELVMDGCEEQWVGCSKRCCDRIGKLIGFGIAGLMVSREEKAAAMIVVFEFGDGGSAVIEGMMVNWW